MQAYLHVQYLITGKKPSVSQEAFLNNIIVFVFCNKALYCFQNFLKARRDV